MRSESIIHQSFFYHRVSSILVLLICSSLSFSCQNRDDINENNNEHEELLTRQPTIEIKADTDLSPSDNLQPTHTELQSNLHFLPMKIGDVKYWAYQLQGIDTWDAVEALAASPYDLLVIEPDQMSDRAEGAFDTRTMVTRIKSSFAHDGIHRKLVIAYVNIGQAEDYRWYWTWPGQWDCKYPLPPAWPDFILACDPDGWKGNFPVAYWDEDWKKIILRDDHAGEKIGNIAAVLEDGFDGVYMDWVAGFEDETVAAAAREAGIDPTEEMGKYLQQIRKYSRQINPSFLLIQQNGAALAQEYPASMRSIDAISQECIWYCGSASDTWEDSDGHDMAVDKEETTEIISYLESYLSASIPVFSVDYALSNAWEVYKKAANYGLIAYVSRTPLSNLTTTPPPGLISQQ